MKLINYQYVKNEVDISQNILETALDNPIKRSQEMLEMVIGETLVAELVSQHPNYSDANVTLIGYVKPFLAYQAYQFWLPKANLQSHASGIRIHEEDNSRAATDAEMATLIRDAKMWAQTKKDKLVQFLEDNCETYPLYDCVNCGKTNTRTGTGFHITSVGRHKKGCSCDTCRGHS